MTSYSDLNANYSPKNVMTAPSIKDVEAIKDNLLRLFSTPVGSVPFNRNFGSHLHELLFENNISAYDAAMFLYMDITEFEPRVSLSPSDISIEKVDEHTYSVSCVITIPSLNNQVLSIGTNISDQN